MLIFKTTFFTKIAQNKKLYYGLSFFLPFLSLLIYFAFTHFNFLTVDLGQQYIDFLSFLRQNLFTHPGKLIYNFQNGLGGSMLATDAYYLNSPFNLLVFLFPLKQLPLAVLLIIASKFGAAGVSAYYYWQNKVSNNYALAGALAYALSGYTVAYYFNLMWLDSVILLPLLVKAIDQTFKQERDRLTLITFLLWFTNFYSGIMALFFGLLYFICKLLLQEKHSRLSILANYLIKGMIGTVFAAFILLPVFVELLTGRADTSTTWSLSAQFTPYQEIGKLLNGAYSYHEMEEGMPNIFLTTPFLLLALTYFFQSKISIKQRLIFGILFIFLISSLFFTPFVLIWHLGQFPTWYPGRFSFVLIFFSLQLAFKSLAAGSISFKNKVIIGLFSCGIVALWYFCQDQFSFLTDTKLIVSICFVVLALLFIFFIFGQHPFASSFLLLIVTVEAIINLIFTLDSISFQNNKDYVNFAANTQEAAAYLTKNDSQLYRTEKTFYRSDDDPFTSNYNGLSNFNSINNPQIINFMTDLGYLHNSNSFTNYGGTLLTDSLLGVRYYLQPNYARENHQAMLFENGNHRLDLEHYRQKKVLKNILVSCNPLAMPLVFTSPVQKKMQLSANAPINNQEQFLSVLLNKKVHLFKQAALSSPTLIGVNKGAQNGIYVSKGFTKQSKVTYQIKLTSNNSYYLEIPAAIDDDYATLTINGEEVDLNSRDDQNYLLNLASSQKGLKLKIVFTLKHQSLDLSDLKLVELNTKAMKNYLSLIKQNQPKLYAKSALVLQTNSFNNGNQALLTTIPYSKNWLIFDHGRLLKTSKFADTFLQAKIKQGKHQLLLIYVPWMLLIGLLISLLSLIAIKVFSIDLKRAIIIKSKGYKDKKERM